MSDDEAPSKPGAPFHAAEATLTAQGHEVFSPARAGFRVALATCVDPIGGAELS